VLGALVALCNFLAYGTTAQVARLHGAGEHARAGQLAAQALWLALGVGVALALFCVAFAGPVMDVVGGSGQAADDAARYVRISAAGLPFALVALAGNGFLRGIGDLRTPLVILVVANLVNVVLEVVLVYGFDLGLDGSALGTVVAQAGMGAAFVVLLLRAPAVSRRPVAALLRRLSSMGGHLVVRTGALLGAFTLAAAVLARAGDDALAAHQIAFQLFLFLALVLDAIAIAGQVIVGRRLGAGDAASAWDAGRRMVFWSVVVGCAFAVLLALLGGLLPRAFTSDRAVLDRAAELWPLFALLMPVGAVVFALDGILIGAGDTRFIARAMVLALAAFAPVALGLAGLGVGRRRRLGGDPRADGGAAGHDDPALHGPPLGGRRRLGPSRPRHAPLPVQARVRAGSAAARVASARPRADPAQRGSSHHHGRRAPRGQPEHAAHLGASLRLPRAASLGGWPPPLRARGGRGAARRLRRDGARRIGRRARAHPGLQRRAPDLPAACAPRCAPSTRTPPTAWPPRRSPSLVSRRPSRSSCSAGVDGLAAGTPEHALGERWGAGWLAAQRRLAPPASRPDGVLVLDAGGPDVLHVAGLELVLRRAGLRVLVLPVALEPERLQRAITVLDPSLVVLGGRGAALDAVGRAVFAARRARGERVAVCDFRGASGASTTVPCVGPGLRAARDAVLALVAARPVAADAPEVAPVPRRGLRIA
jgi:putative MATE family efflux protein